jgi:hypothetical protein
MKRTIFISFLALVLAAAIYFLFIFKKPGAEIDSHNGVVIYYNGLSIGKSHGKHFSVDGYYFGKKWQCVEFVKRYYKVHLDHEMPEVYGHAKSFFDPQTAHGEINKERNLLQFENGKDESPELDDILVFTNTKYGHVAVVSKVFDDKVEVVQQNVGKRSRRIFKLNWIENNCTVGTDRKPSGWLRKRPD